MAVAAAILTVAPHPLGADSQQQSAIRRGTVTGLAGNTYPALGVPVNWGKLVSGETGGTAIGPNQAGQVNQYSVQVFSVASSATLPGYTYQYDPTHGTIRMLTGGTELTTGATISVNELTGFYAEYPRAL